MIGHSPADTSPVLVGVDVGGTFTDAVLVDGGRLVTAKVPTTPEDQGVAVVAAVREALRRAGRGPADVTAFAHGMTVGTNALLEGTWARAALVVTAGFGDLLELRRQRRADLYRLEAAHPPPIVDRDHVVEVAERCGPEGVITPLADAEIARVVAQVVALAPEAVAVGLLFSFAHPEHELRLSEALRAALPGVPVSASCEVLPEIREYERLATTAVDAALAPVLGQYLTRLASRSADAGLPSPVIMQSNGGVVSLAGAAEHAAWTVMSGPAGGVIGAALAAAADGAPLALAFDMGGTSCDVALVREGTPSRRTENTVGGHPVHLPMLDVETVSAGGGSIAWRDSGGAMRVGPHSAGSRPGPAAYGRGGTQPTVTDANVVLGRLPLDGELGGEIRLDPAAARAAVEGLAGELGLGPEECARGILAVAVEEMVRALRRVSVERGVDPRGATLVAFGGAGPLHACQVADALGAGRALVPAAAGLLAALGLVVAGERRDHVRTVLLPVASGADLETPLAALAARADADLPGAPVEVSVDCRYVGQSHSLTVSWNPAEGQEALAAAFHRAHERELGDSDPALPVEAVSLRLAAERPGVRPQLPAAVPGAPVTGPAILPADGATVWVEPGWRAIPRGDGSILLERT